jgi:hypothetical protein
MIFSLFCGVLILGFQFAQKIVNLQPLLSH